MIIKRMLHDEEVEIDLTPEEMRLAGEESELSYRAEDVVGKMEEMAENGDIPLTLEQFKQIPADVLREFALGAAADVENALGKNDSYWESFWLSVEYVLEDRINWDEALPILLSAAA